MKKSLLSVAVMLVFTMGIIGKAFAQDQIEKIWYNQEKTSKIKIYLAKDGNYYGIIYWLKEPNDVKTGKPRTDVENPDESQRTVPLQNMIIMRKFKKNPNNPNEYTDGTIYDPKKGKTYCGKITMKGNTLDLRGYICSMSFLGRTETWTLAEGQ